ncbi:MAG: hypothetical protein ABR548_12055 [Actinomycetota bacterium]|nr:hypothetical protein [Actinomycetota bacterium]
MAKRWRVFVVAAAGFLLISQGAQIAAAPLTVPALWWSARSTDRRGEWVTHTIVAGLTMAFVGWFGAYQLLGEKQPFIWAVPFATLMATVAFFNNTAWRKTAT